MSKSTEQEPDDLDATRRVVETLTPFKATDRERILRWAREKLGMTAALGIGAGAELVAHTTGGSAATATMTGGEAPPRPTMSSTDIKTFVAYKNPKSDTQTAAVVAYYYRFVAPEAERKETISSADLLEACRLSDRQRPAVPAQTMINAYRSGVFDKVGYGQYRLNAVGENLVAMVLPGDGAEQSRPVPRGRAKHKTKARMKTAGRAKTRAKGRK